MSLNKGFFREESIQRDFPKLTRALRDDKSRLSRARKDHVALIMRIQRIREAEAYIEVDSVMLSFGSRDPAAVAKHLQSLTEKMKRAYDRSQILYQQYSTDEEQEAGMTRVAGRFTAPDKQLDVERELQEAQSRAEMGNDEILNAYSHLFGVKL